MQRGGEKECYFERIIYQITCHSRTKCYLCNIMKYSIIVPVFNRPDEVEELLESLLSQEEKDFEVVIVEDGSQIPCKEVCDKYADKLDLHYYSKENSGPGQSRNYGAERAKGEYLLILDSDVVLPKGYIRAVSEELKREPADAFGGPDCAHESFTDTQKAISYSMTSFLRREEYVVVKRNLTSSILVHSIWVSVVMSIRNWEVSQRCVLERISTSRFVSLRQESVADCSLRHGFGTSVVRTSASSGSRFTTLVSPESTSIRSTLSR